jgi:hypothetical protein
LNCNNPNSENHNRKVYELIRANGGWDNFTFAIIEEIKECNKIQAHIREEFHRQELKANMNTKCCFSGVVDYNTKEEYRKKYYEIKLNKDHKKEFNKQYQEDNKEQIKLQRKQYREENKEKIKEQEAQPYSCECGSKCMKKRKLRHFKSKKHQTYLANLNLKEPNL